MSPERSDDVLILVAAYPPAYLAGGPARTIEAMVERRLSDGRVEVLTSAHDLGMLDPLPVPADDWIQVGRAQVRYCNVRSWRGRWGLVRAVRRSTSSTLYLNSLLEPWFSIIPLLLRRLGLTRFRQVVLAPRGELELSALALKSPKKRVFLRVAGLFGLHRGVTFHASSEHERGSVLRQFPGAEVVVREDESLTVPRTDVPEEKSGPLRIVTLGRISPVKRVHVLIEAMALMAPGHDITFAVHGGGEPDYTAFCRDTAARLGVDVDFTGAVPHEEVGEVFRGTDVACFATAGENFGHVMAEAMAQGCPVLVGDVTPWTPTVAAGGGIVVAHPEDPRSWADLWGELAQESPAQRLHRRRAALAAFMRWHDARPDGTFLDVLGSRAAGEGLAS